MAVHGAEVILREFNGWPVGYIGGDGVPRISDVEICNRSGYGDIYKLRQKIREFAAEDKLRSEATGKPRKFNPFGVSTDSVESGGRPGTVFWLNQHEAVFLMSQIKTPFARDVTHDVIDVFVMATQGELPQQKKAKSGNLKHAKAITRIVGLMSSAVSAESKDAALGKALVLLTGQREVDVLPELPSARWYQPSEIAVMTGFNEQIIGRRITKLGLRGHPVHCRGIMSKQRGSDTRDVTSYKYDHDALEMILKDLKEDPPKPSKPKKKRPPDQQTTTATEAAPAEPASDAPANDAGDPEAA